MIGDFSSEQLLHAAPPLLIESVVLKQYLNILHLSFETLAPIRNRTTPCHYLNRNPELL